MEQVQTRRTRRSAEEIRVLLEQFDKSGQSAKEFCKTHGINEASFHKMRARQKNQLSAAQNGFAALHITSSYSGTEALLFAEVKGIKIYQPVTASYLKELSSL